MRYSIRYKLFVIVSLILISFFLIIYLFNAYLLDDIFIWNNEKAMRQIYRDFLEKLDRGYDKENTLYEIVNEYGGNITLIDSKKRVIFSTYPGLNRIRLERLLIAIFDHLNKFRENMQEDTEFIVTSQDNHALRQMVFIGKLPDESIFIAERSMRSIYDSSQIAGKFIIFTGLLTFLFTSITVYFVAVKVTKPIIHMNKVAQDIANLDFNNKVKVSSQDEIGMLGNSINNISGELSSVLSQLMKANKKLQSDIEHERSLEKMRRRFVSSVSHELKTPISMIQGYADGLKFNIAKKPEDVQYYCDVIIEESEKMNHLVKDLMDLSSYESGAFKISKTEFDLVELIKYSSEKYRITLADRGVKLEVNSPSDCIVNADRLRIEQVMSNFISNAQKHVIENGSIRIDLEKSDDDVCLRFFNTGEHIEESEMENIWTSFYKIQSKDYYASVGTGLGLAVVRAIVELHDGSYGVKNVEQGVSFWIKLPRK